MAENGETKVRFSLWAVLGFLCVLAAILFGDLYLSQRTIQKDAVASQVFQSKQTQEVCDRVTRLEANYIHIIDGISRIEGALKEHERSSRRRGE